MDKMYAPSRHTFHLSQGIGSDVSSFYTSLPTSKQSTLSSSSSSSSSSLPTTAGATSITNLSANERSHLTQASSPSSSSSCVKLNENITSSMTLCEDSEDPRRSSSNEEFVHVKNNDENTLKHDKVNEEESFDRVEEIEKENLSHENTGSNGATGPVWFTESESVLSQSSLQKESYNNSQEDLESSPRRSYKQKKQYDENQVEEELSHSTASFNRDNDNTSKASPQYVLVNDDYKRRTKHQRFNDFMRYEIGVERLPEPGNLCNVISEPSSLSPAHAPAPLSLPLTTPLPVSSYVPPYAPPPVHLPIPVPSPPCDVIQAPSVWHFDPKGLLEKSKKRSAQDAFTADDDQHVLVTSPHVLTDDEIPSQKREEAEEPLSLKTGHQEESTVDAERRLSRVLVKNVRAVLTVQSLLYVLQYHHVHTCLTLHFSHVFILNTILKIALQIQKCPSRIFLPCRSWVNSI